MGWSLYFKIYFSNEKEKKIAKKGKNLFFYFRNKHDNNMISNNDGILKRKRKNQEKEKNLKQKIFLYK